MSDKTEVKDSDNKSLYNNSGKITRSATTSRTNSGIHTCACTLSPKATGKVSFIMIKEDKRMVLNKKQENIQN